MGARRTRREFLGIAGLAGVALTAACSRPDAGGRAGSGVVLTHVFGETVVPGPPARVVSAGLTEQDDLLALGVVPVAVTRWLGEQPSGVWPWALPALGPAKPVVLNLDSGIQIDSIAKLKPDLIVAVNAGLDEQTYATLSAIAPTVAQSGTEAFFEPWKDQATAVAAAVFKKDEMARLIETADEKFAAAARVNPAFKDRAALLLDGRFAGDTVTATVGGWRTDFLTAMGLAVPESVKALAADNGQAVITREELPSAVDSADVLIWCTDNDAEEAALLADPAVAGLRATTMKRNVFTPGELSAAIAYASPLSYPVVTDQLPPLLSRALS